MGIFQNFLVEFIVGIVRPATTVRRERREEKREENFAVFCLILLVDDDEIKSDQSWKNRRYIQQLTLN